jgi:hypothetical protein
MWFSSLSLSLSLCVCVCCIFATSYHKMFITSVLPVSLDEHNLSTRTKHLSSPPAQFSEGYVFHNH